MIGKVCGTGAYIPEKIVTNFDMAEIVETNDEWIRERTGVEMCIRDRIRDNGEWRTSFGIKY